MANRERTATGVAAEVEVAVEAMTEAVAGTGATAAAGTATGAESAAAADAAATEAVASGAGAACAGVEAAAEVFASATPGTVSATSTATGAGAAAATEAVASGTGTATGTDAATPIGVEGSALLEVSGINVYYGAIHAIKDVSFEVRAGEVVALIGANGAGKSTTLKTLSGLLRSRTGSIAFAGEDIMHVPADKLVARGLAHVPEGRRVFAQMSVAENLEMGAYTRPASEVAGGLERVYAHFPRLAERRRQLAGTLSGGEQQMLAMGRALMSSPKLLMLDEPSMGLAPLLIEQIFDIIRELHAAGTTILLVEQNAQMALSVATRGYVMETGRVTMTGTGAELLANDDVRRAYLGG